MSASDLEDDYDFEVSDLNCNDSLFLRRPANRNRQSDQNSFRQKKEQNIWRDNTSHKTYKKQNQFRSSDKHFSIRYQNDLKTNQARDLVETPTPANFKKQKISRTH